MFADTEPTREGIKAFADRFGPLGRTVEKPIPLDDQRNAKGVPLGMGESLADWHNEILTMRLAIDIWEAVRRGDVDLLGRLILWTEDGSGVRIMSHPELTDRQLPDPPAYVERAWIASTHHGDDVLGRFVRGDLVKPALHYVQSTINQHLENRIGRACSGTPSGRGSTSTRRRTISLAPSGCSSPGPWSATAKFRQCAECGIWFELAPGTARADKLYCSTPCRTKAYRKRQAEAARLHGEGRSIEDIARDLDSDPDTVRGWIERKGRIGRIAPERDRVAASGGVGAHDQFVASDDPDRCLAGANALAPDLMTADERLTEVAQILAAGILRLRQRLATPAAALEKNGLDLSPDRSGHATARQRRQVGR